MHPIVKNILERENARAQEFRFALKKAFDMMGNVYAPLFFCAASLMGIALPLLAWKTGSVLNALLGARGVGTLTSELTQGMWMMIVALVVFFAGRLLLARLEGKLNEVFMRLAYIAEIVMLLLLSANVLSVFIVHFSLFFMWRIFEERRVRAAMVTVWFAGIVWMFFSLATDVALRVSTLGDMVSILAICALFYCAVTRPFFKEA